MTDKHRIQIKVGDAEFSAEGAEGVVMDQFREWLGWVRTRSGAAEAPLAPTPPAVDQTPPADGNGQPPPPPTPDEAADDARDQALIRRLFSDTNGMVSLLALPSGENAQADAVLLCIYGYGRLTGQETISAVGLMKALRKSGLKMDRIDRSITPHIGTLITKSGLRRGTRYGLTNRGLTKAKELMRATLN